MNAKNNARTDADARFYDFVVNDLGGTVCRECNGWFVKADTCPDCEWRALVDSPCTANDELHGLDFAA